MASKKMIFKSSYVVNLAFRLPWQQIKFKELNKNDTFGRGQLNEHFCKTVVKISAVR